jgi:hypothetical protein
MYEVGQVLYLILNKKQQVIPAQVVEQTVRRTLAGEEILHSVKIPGEQQAYKLEELGAEAHISLSSVQEKLHMNATVVIDTMILQASELAEKSFDISPSNSDNPFPVNTSSLSEKSKRPGRSRKRKKSKKEESESVQVTLENGTVANVSLSNLPTS